VSEVRIEPYVPDSPFAEANAAQRDDQPATMPRRQKRLRILIGALLALLAAVALWSVVWQPRSTPVYKPAASTAPPSPPVVQDAPAARYPIEAEAVALPPLDSSDGSMLTALLGVFGGRLSAYLEPRDLVRNFVVTIDNLPRRTLPAQRSPLRPAPGMFVTTNAGQGLVIADANAQRYAPYVQLFEHVETARIVAFYVRHYPLFQQAYRELGYPAGHFNDRLVEAIDLLLATPEAGARLRVVQPKVFFEYADRDLEALPSGQKLMLRIGPENSVVVKRKLREIRELLTAPGPQPREASAAVTPR
jgi:hypothetical protein